MEPILMSEYGVTKAKNYTNNRRNQTRLNEICQRYYSEDS